MSTKTTEGLAADIAECARVEDAARGRFDAAVAELAAAKTALNSARLATNDAIELWRNGCKKDQLTMSAATGSARGRPGTITAWIVEALERESPRVFMAEEVVVAVKNLGHDIGIVPIRTAITRLLSRGEIQRVGRGLYRANTSAS